MEYGCKIFSLSLKRSKPLQSILPLQKKEQKGHFKVQTSMGFFMDFLQVWAESDVVVTSTCQDVERLLQRMMHPWYFKKNLPSIELYSSLRKFTSCIQVTLSNVIGLGCEFD